MATRNKKPPRRPTSATKSPDEGPVRLQRFLASAGVASRRQCEELIREGRVAIDGRPVIDLGVRVDPRKQRVELDGTRVREARHQYFVVNKPAGVLSTCNDPAGRARVIDLIPSDERVYNVGRLDKSSEGLIIVTNDGALANRLTHPRYDVPKTYLVTIAGTPSVEVLQMLRQGVRLAEGFARVDEVRIRKQHRQSCELWIVLREGRNREIRRLLARIGHKVLQLKRVAIGTLRLGELPPGGWRRLESNEIAALMRLPGIRDRKESRGRSKSGPAKKGKGRTSSSGRPSSSTARPVAANKTRGRDGVKKARRSTS